MTPTCPPFHSKAVARSIAGNIWRYLSPAASVRELELEIAALTGITRADLRTLGRLQFLLSDELHKMLEEMPHLLRRLAASTAAEEIRSADRIQGPIHWPKSIAARATSGQVHLYVTNPSSRAFDTPENRLLVFLLHEIVEQSRHLQWSAQHDEGLDESTVRREPVAHIVHRRTSAATHALRRRRLAGIPASPPSVRDLVRVRTGRHRRTYRHVLDTYIIYDQLVRRVDATRLKDALALRTLLATDEGRLFEIFCLFHLIDALRGRGWHLDPLRLVRGKLELAGVRDGDQLSLWYESTPTGLRDRSRYRAVMNAHHLKGPPLRPDFTIWLRSSDGTEEWIILESKLSQRRLRRAASAATRDLLAYRRAFDHALGRKEGPYGIGLIWGRDLAPNLGPDIMLTTPDRIGAALAAVGL